MNELLPRIESVAVESPSVLRVGWRGADTVDTVDLAGWIATGGELLAPLRDSAVFRTAAVGDYGTAVVWAEDDDLAIDAAHLELLAAEQKPFGAQEAATWQADMGLSNQEAAGFLHVVLSTWNSYKAGSPIPEPIAMLCRAARRDPILMQAHYRPRKTGRPRKEVAGV